MWLIGLLIKRRRKKKGSDLVMVALQTKALTANPRNTGGCQIKKPGKMRTKERGKEKRKRRTGQKKIISSWSKSSFGFVCHILWKNLNKLLGQPNVKHSMNVWSLKGALDRWTSGQYLDDFFHFLLFQYLPRSPPPVFSCSFLPVNDLISEEISEEVLPFCPFPQWAFFAIYFRVSSQNGKDLTKSLLTKC